MKKLLLLMILITLSGCASAPAEDKPVDTDAVPLTVQDTAVPADTDLPEPSAADDTAALEEIAERCEQKAAELLKERFYQIIGETQSHVVRYGDVKGQCTIPEKLVYYTEVVDDTLFLLVTVPTDMGDILLLYNAGGMMMLDNPPKVKRPVPALHVNDHSLTADPSAAVTVYGIRKFQLGYDERAPLLFRITSRQELEKIYPMITEQSDDGRDYTYEFTGTYDPERITGWMNLTECYDTAWFEKHDLWIAVQEGTSSTPDLYADIDGNTLRITYEACEVVTDDIIGRQVLIEVSKGDIITWEDTDGRYHTPETYTPQKDEWFLEDCYDTCIRMIEHQAGFVTALPTYQWTVFGDIPEEYHCDTLKESAEQLEIHPDSPVLRMDVPSSDGIYTIFFDRHGRCIDMHQN